MVQYIKQPNALAQFGTGFGQGLAEQLPKEIERGRLAGALKNVQGMQNASPLEQFSYLAPYMADKPQLLQNTTELLKHAAQTNALKQQADIQGQPRQNPFQNIMDQESQGTPSITTPEGIEATKGSYIPPTYSQILARAGQLAQQNPQLYGNDPNKAIAAAQEEANLEKARNEAFQGRRQNEKGLLGDLKTSLQNEAERRGVKIPGNEYTELENQAKEMFKPKSEGGRGMTEEQIKDELGKRADDISRDYQNLKNLGPGLVLGRETKETKRSMESLRKKFADRGQLENFADTLVSDLKLSPQVAAYYTYPVKDNREISNYINGLPKLTNNQIIKENPDASFDDIERIKGEKTIKAAPEIAKMMGKNDSPMAIAMYMRSKGYDPYEFLTYLSENRKKLQLTEAQGRELDKPRNFTPTLSDNWMLFSTGLDELVER